MIKRLVLVSNNKNKIVELQTMLKEYLPGYKIIPIGDIGYDEEIKETGSSFEENSFLKAMVPTELGYIGIADDSGLCVDALGGRPGVYSARYSGEGDEENVKKLLKEMEDVPDNKRTAKFVCVMTAVFPDGRVIQAKGTVDGLITRVAHGGAGFGYDPVFYYVPFGKTFSQLSPKQKNAISHRKKALVRFCELLKRELEKC